MKDINQKLLKRKIDSTYLNIRIKKCDQQQVKS